MFTPPTMLHSEIINKNGGNRLNIYDIEMNWKIFRSCLMFI